MKELSLEFFYQNFGKGDIYLHEPIFEGKEMNFLEDAVKSTYVSSIGEYVNLVEQELSTYVGCKYGIACVNGTAGLHLALLSSGVGLGDEVITQAFSFVATANAISYTGASPVFLDIDESTLGLSSKAIEEFLKNHTRKEGPFRVNKHTGRTIKACVPMNSFGIPADLDKISIICQENNITLIEDAAESFGSKFNGKHTGSFGKAGVFSFNGNKIITAGGGGLVVTDNEFLAKRIKHLSTQAKANKEGSDFFHDEIGYNYRMPNINAALLFGQFQNIDKYILSKKILFERYSELLSGYEGIQLIDPNYRNRNSNNWLISAVCENEDKRNELLFFLRKNRIYARKPWDLLSQLPAYRNSFSDSLKVSQYFYDRLINLPSFSRLIFREI